MRECISYYCVASEKINKMLDKLKDAISFTDWKETASRKEIYVTGSFINELMKVDKIETSSKWELDCSWLYRLIIFDSEKSMKSYRSRGSTKAIKLINNSVIRDKEPYKEKVERKPDMEININDFPFNNVARGYWCSIDMNSAEPYYVSKRLPELSWTIESWYKLRKKKPEYKQALVSINGHLRNTHVSVYEGVVSDLYNEMQRIAIEADKFCYVFAVRRDALILYRDRAFADDTELGNRLGIELGDGLGQFKITRDYGRISVGDSTLNYTTDMKYIESKCTGTHIVENKHFLAIEFCFDICEKTTIKINYQKEI